MNYFQCLIVVGVVAVAVVSAEHYHGGGGFDGHGHGHGGLSSHGGGGGGGGHGGHGGHGDNVDYYAPPHYAFEYKIQDPHTGDFKSQHETREGDVVKGFYTLKEADGTIREVHYTSDKKNGFNAEVKRTGHAQHPQHYKTEDHH